MMGLQPTSQSIIGMQITVLIGTVAESITDEEVMDFWQLNEDLAKELSDKLIRPLLVSEYEVASS